MHKQKIKAYKDIEEFDYCEKLSDIIKISEELLVKYGDVPVRFIEESVTLTIMREETDIEFSRRVAKEQKKAAKELAQYQKLKEKYEQA